ncbi:MAG: hypothetical protein M3N08_08800 [Pseudomonadota bacterium]|nr:hypothetical protein [Pseudomonadota bacterium]
MKLRLKEILEGFDRAAAASVGIYLPEDYFDAPQPRANAAEASPMPASGEQPTVPQHSCANGRGAPTIRP